MVTRVLIHQSEAVRQIRTAKIKDVIRKIAADYGWNDGEISVALVSDVEIHEVNRVHLAHDYPTDVISFDLTESEDLLEGEIIASVEMADASAAEHGWSGDDELLLYVIHGMLHIVGLDDKRPTDIKRMRAEEEHYIAEMRG